MVKKFYQDVVRIIPLLESVGALSLQDISTTGTASLLDLRATHIFKRCALGMNVSYIVE